MILNLNGDSWILKGWMRYQWNLAAKMETGVVSVPAYGPFPARVPGGVHSDLLRAGAIEDWNYGTNSLKSEWIEHREWSYERGFELPPEMDGQDIILHCDGLDFSGQVEVNGVIVLRFKGMHKRFEADITAACKKRGKNKLAVLFYQPPEVDALFGYTSRKSELKSRFNYTWDWCPRIVNTGIWRDIYIQSVSKACIKDFYPKAAVSGDNKTICISLETDIIESGDYTVKYTLGQDKHPPLTGVHAFASGRGRHTEIFTIDAGDVRLWYPNGYGEHPLYEIKVELQKDEVCVDCATKKVGFRSIEFIKNEDSKNALAYTCVVNGEKIFIRGFNWTPLSPIYGTVTRQDYIRYLSIFKNANVNMIRVWGGAILESVDFYDICDENGLMVWQEFTQSSSGIDNTPCEEKEFIEDIVSVAKEHVLRRRHHACHALWCGGNELMWDNAVPVDFRSRNLSSLKGVVDTLDSGKYMLPASPSGNFFNFSPEHVGEYYNHEVHGPWDYLGDVAHYRHNNIDDSLFSSEVGCPAMPRLESIIKYSGGCKTWPADETNPYYMHRGAWWIRIREFTHMFGAFADDGSQLDEYVAASRYIQAESLGYSAQSARRAFPHRSGFIIWAGNEPFPNCANCSVIEYDGTAKPAYYRVKTAYAAVDVSAKYDKIGWKSGETFEAEIGAVSDAKINDFILKAEIFNVRGILLAEQEYKCDISKYHAAGKIRLKLDHPETGVFLLRVSGFKDGKLVALTDYTFTADAENPFAPIRNLPKTAVSYEKTGESYKIYNRGIYAAVGVFGYVKAGETTINLDKGSFTLLPGESAIVSPQSPSDGELALSAMNML